MMMMMMMRTTTNQRFYLSTTYHISHENFEYVHLISWLNAGGSKKKEDASSCQEAIRSLIHFLSASLF